MEGFEPKRTAADPAAAENLKHIARLLDQGVPLSLKINGRRVAMPAGTNFAVNLDRDPRSGCVEVDIRWSLAAGEKSSPPSKGGVAGASADGVVNGRPASRHRGDTNPLNKCTGRNPHIRLKALITAPKI